MIVANAGWDAVDAAASARSGNRRAGFPVSESRRADERRLARMSLWRRRVAAYGEVVWSWHPLLMSSRRRRSRPNRVRPAISVGDGDKRNSSPGRARGKPLKPLRGEGRSVSAEPVCSCALCCVPLHARPRVQRAPGLPCALVLRGTVSSKTLGASRRGNADACLPGCLTSLIWKLRRSFVQASFRDGPKDQTSDAQLRIGESRDSGFARFARAPE
jgi:hypothetical protein